MLDEEEEVLPPEQLDDSPSIRQNTPIEDMQSLEGSIQQPNAPNEMFGEEQHLEHALTEKQNETKEDDFDQFFTENQ